MDDYGAAAASSEWYLRGVLKTRRRYQTADEIIAIIGLALLVSRGFALPLLGAVLMLYGLIDFRLAGVNAGLAFIQDGISLLEVKVDRMDLGKKI